MNEKQCTKCKEVKPVCEFGRGSHFGIYSHYCLSCQKEYRIAYYQKNKERLCAEKREYNKDKKSEISEKKKVYYLKNKKRENARNRESYLRNSDARKEQARKYYEKNREQIIIRECKRKKNNREKINLIAKERRKTDIAFNVREKISGRIRTAIKKQSAAKKNNTIKLLGCDFETFKKYFTSLFTDGMTWEFFLSGEIHIDHIVPCSYFDLSNEQQQLACFNYKNLQPLWASDNYSKRDKILEPSQMVLGL